MSTKQIAIDGPAGAGKSTIARMVADRLGFIYIDTGAMYRAAALYLLRGNIDPADERASAAAVAGADIRLVNENGNQKILLNGEDVTGQIRTQEVGAAASLSSRYRAVREKLTGLQREIAEKENVVMDGRDIGTTVLPDAQLKIYLTADASVRAKRRYDQLVEKGTAGLSPDEIEAEIRARDRQDMERKNSPLRKAEDAVLVDSSDLSIDEVCAAILKEYQKVCR